MSLTLRLSRSDLTAAGACADGLKLFDTIKAGQDDVRAAAGRKPRRALRLRYGLLEQLWMATAYPSFFGWLVDVGLLPSVHGRRADLFGANLRGADLRGANLRGADLRGADLFGANLRGADLFGANLFGANLFGANLFGANLFGANLRGTRNWPSAVELPEGWRIATCKCCVERDPGGAS